jgi:hypothetical protein
MIESHRPTAPLRRWWWWLAFVAAVVVMLLGGAALARSWARGPSTPTAASLRLDDPPLEKSPAPSVPPPSPAPSPALAAVPVTGTGKFRYAPGHGPVLGRSGTLRTFHVAVEIGTGQDAAAFAGAVQRSLGDKRSWIGTHTMRLQRVAPNRPADFTVYLATRTTAGRLCRAGGLNISAHGLPFTSCRTTAKAIINLDRWMRSAPPYVAAGVPLAVYRTYVINHEVGHELGHGHEGCPKKAGPAPVMMQQTLSMRGCRPNPWPRPSRGTLLYGPPA